MKTRMNTKSITTLLIVSLLLMLIPVVGNGSDGGENEKGPIGGARNCNGTLDGTRWCDQGDGTIKDMTTGLVWLKDALWGGLHPFWTTTASGVNANDRASQVRDGNPSYLTDGSLEGEWRLPTKEELNTFFNGDQAIRCETGTCENVHGFTGVVANVFWTSTVSSTDPNSAWAVESTNGLRKAGAKTNNAIVWPVRHN
ncbi:MAG: DUF1566 domain-containing protein [bacterium]|nr:DUF1566 domain-containing protein [bacterium]